MKPNRSHKQHPPPQTRNTKDKPQRPNLQTILPIILLTTILLFFPILTATTTTRKHPLQPLLASNPHHLQPQHRRNKHQHKHMPTNIMPPSPRAPRGLTSCRRQHTLQSLSRSPSRSARVLPLHRSNNPLAFPTRNHKTAIDNRRSEKPLRHEVPHRRREQIPQHRLRDASWLFRTRRGRAVSGLRDKQRDEGEG